MSTSIQTTLESLRKIQSFLYTKLHEEKKGKMMSMDDYLCIQKLAEKYIPEAKIFNDQEHQIELLASRFQECWDDVRAGAAAIYKWKYLSRAKQRTTTFESLQEGQVYELDPSGDLEIERLSLTRSGHFVAMTFIGGEFPKPRTIAINLNVLPYMEYEKTVTQLMVDDLEELAAQANEQIMDLSRPKWVDRYVAYSDHASDDPCMGKPIQSFEIYR